VVQLYADGFEQLKTQEKIPCLLPELGRPGWARHCHRQHHRNALEVRQVFEQIDQYSAGIDPSILRKLDDYLKLSGLITGSTTT
jgi:hypothetical protein